MKIKSLDAPHPMLLAAAHDDFAREAFCRSLTNYLETEARPSLREFYVARVGPALRVELGRDPQRREIADAMRGIPANRLWYLLRTTAQQLSYLASDAVIEGQRPALVARARMRQGARGTLKLDPKLKVPRYVSAHDVHHMPGSYVREHADDDVGAGALFDRQMTVNRFGSQGVLNDDPGVSLAAGLRERFPGLRPKRILELGCTVGHTLLPFKLAWPDAEVHGIDVSAPCLRYAHARASHLDVEVHWSQRNAESTGLPDGSFDLVFSRILMHETSRSAVPRILAECQRLLSPGGVTFHSDAPQFDELDPYTASLRDWDVRCNNEPFMGTYYEMPVESLLVDAGFRRESTFRGYAPSRHLATHAVDPRLNRSGGRYFYVGAVK